MTRLTPGLVAHVTDRALVRDPGESLDLSAEVDRAAYFCAGLSEIVACLPPEHQQRAAGALAVVLEAHAAQLRRWPAQPVPEADPPLWPVPAAGLVPVPKVEPRRVERRRRTSLVRAVAGAVRVALGRVEMGRHAAGVTA